MNIALTFKITQEEIDKVLAAFSEPEYTWRTLGGVARDTNISKERVYLIIKEIGTRTVGNYDGVLGINGEPLYILWKTFYKELGFWGQLCYHWRHH